MCARKNTVPLKIIIELSSELEKRLSATLRQGSACNEFEAFLTNFQ